MRPYLVELLNRVFGTTVFTYLLPNYLMLLSAGAFVGTVYAARRARARGLNPEVYYGLILWALPAALIGGRAMGFLYAPETYGGSLLNLLDPLRGDSAAYGGFIGGVGAGIGYMLYRGVEVWRYLDCSGPPLGVAAAFTRVGCFLDGCDFGCITAWPLSVTFPAGSDAYQAHLDVGLIPAGAMESLPVHPVQLYLAVGDLALAAIIVGWERIVWRGRRPGLAAGESFLAFWILYAPMRFGLELLRGDEVRGFLGALSTSQAVSVAVLLLAGGFFLARRASARAGPEVGSVHPGSVNTPGGASGALLEVALATVLGAILVRLSLIRGGWPAALAPAVWIYAPLTVLLARGLPLEPHGFSLAAWSRGGRWLFASAAAILAPFAAIVIASRWIAGNPVAIDPARLLSWAPLWQLTLVAIPEEVFFRGYAQQRIRAWGEARGREAAWLPIVAGAAAFAAAHLIVEPGWMRAAVFFPGLVMGWLRERTGGLLAPAGFHWLANLTVLELGGVS